MTNLINQILLEQKIPNSSSINRLICFNKLAKEQKIPSINDIRPIATTIRTHKNKPIFLLIEAEKKIIKKNKKL